MFYLISTLVGGFIVEAENEQKARHYSEVILKANKINDYRLTSGENGEELVEHFNRCPVCGANAPERQVTAQCFQKMDFLKYKTCIKCQFRFNGIELDN